MRVHQVCQNWQEDRIIPRMARALAERLGWGLSAAVDPKADVVHLTGYFEATRMKPWPQQPVAAYFTHREEEPVGNAKSRLFDATAARVQLRIVTCRMYGEQVAQHGPTVEVAAPLERERFTLGPARRGGKPVCGFSGYVYANKRKGEDLAAVAVRSAVGQRVEWRASGRGWPVTTKKLTWAQMAAFYQGLDVLVAPSRVEGIPMPPLEALACGVSVVVPWHVGLLDELPSMPGIHRYERGNAADLVRALEEAVAMRGRVDREALRAATAGYSVEQWVADHAQAFEATFWGESAMSNEIMAAGIEATMAVEATASVEATGAAEQASAEGVIVAEPVAEPVAVTPVAVTPVAVTPVAVTPVAVTPVARESKGSGTRGIYCVAFGSAAREAARTMMSSAKRHMPDVPICLCAAAPIGIEDVFVAQADTDIGGRRAKIRVDELAPPEWETVLYLDADTEVIAPVQQLFEWAEDGWDLVICKDIAPNDVLGYIKAKVVAPEAAATELVTGTWDVLQLNGGVWAFSRNAETAAFFAAWKREWERWAQRDQGALIRALHTHPLRVLTLGNEWNAFPKFQPDQAAAGILHYPGEARRWEGKISSRLDEPAAWAAVRKFEGKRR